MSAPELAIGHIVEGKYELQELLNHGGSVATYRAIMAPNLPVALKFYDPRLESFPDVVNALARCETLTGELPGDLVVHIVDGGKDPVTGALYTVTHFDADPSLEEVVAWGPLSPSEMVMLVHSVARVLDLAHGHGVTHLSLKSTNLFVGPGPAYKVRLVDFAMSLVHDALSPQGLGASARWLAPEQSRGATGGGAAADVFTTALIAFYALTGHSYWRSVESNKVDEYAWQVEIFGNRAPVSQRAKELSVSLDSAFDLAFARALAVSPEERFRTVGMFAQALDAAIEASASTASTAAPVFAAEPPIAADLIAEELDEPAATSTSAFVLAPSPAPDAARPSIISETAVAVDVPPPPAQMDAVLAAFESTATQRLPTRSAATSSSGTEPLGVRVPVRSTAAGRWPSVFWIAGVAAGALIAVGIVRKISVNQGPSAQGLESAASASTASVPTESEARPAPTSANPAAEDPAPSATMTTAVEQHTRAPTGKPPPKTVRSPAPAQPRGAASAPRKPCGKLLKPCK